MARYIGPKCKLCRREGVKLFLKGSRCVSEKCALSKRAQVPGQHFRRRPRESDYGRHLREKQKAKRIYGLLEAQFKAYFEKASKIKGITGELFLQMLELRLDSVVYLAGFVSSRQSARQLIRHKKVNVNGVIVDIPSYQVSVGNLVTVKNIETKTKDEKDFPAWMEWDGKNKGVSILNLPSRGQISSDVNEQIIVEFYSR